MTILPIRELLQHDTPISHLRNALQILSLTDPYKDGALVMTQQLMAAETRVMKALTLLERQ